MRQDHRDDAGFSLVEVIVAMLVLSFVLTAVGAMLTSTLSVTRQNTQRVAAAGIAQQAIEAARSQRALDIVDGRSIPLGPVTMDGTTYSVVQDATYLATGVPTNVCSGSGNLLQYKSVTQTVTWSDMGPVRPVRADTVVSLGLNGDGLSAANGAVATRVQDSSGQPVPDVDVTVAGRTTKTGADGCAVFANVVPGTYVASVTAPGMVGIQGGQAVSSPPLAVTAATIKRYVFDYDRAGALSVSITTPAGYSVPSGVAVPVTLDNATFTPSSARVFYDCSVVPTAPQSCVSGAPRLAGSLYPGSYAAWAGACADSRPSPRPSLVDVTRGGTTSVTAELGGVDVTFRGSAGGPQDATVYAIHEADATCPTTTVWSLGFGRSFRVALPEGRWTFTTTADGSGTNWPSANVRAGVVQPAGVRVDAG
jgi:prepilin-type N-terminal cleavage/methylation domain-containing protein